MSRFMICLLGLALVLFADVARAQEPYNYTKRENSEWANISISEPLKTDLPRVALIGDSITVRYNSAVGNALRGKAYLTLLGISKPAGDPALLDTIRMVLRQNKYDVIQFNNGLHGGMGYTNEDFRAGLTEIFTEIRKLQPQAKIIWATITPTKGDGMNKNVIDRNAIAVEVLKAFPDVQVNDLNALAVKQVENPELAWDGSGVHFTNAGAEYQGKAVGQYLLQALGIPAQP